MATTNEQLLDAFTRHQIFVIRFSGFVRNNMNAVLNRSEQDVADSIRKNLANNEGLSTPAEFRRFQTTVESVNGIRAESWADAGKQWADDAVAFSAAEPAIIGGIVDTVSPVVIDLSLPSATTMRSIALARPFQGRLLRGWVADMNQSERGAITRAIQTGMTQGESVNQITRRIIGTKSLKGSDGVTQLSRNHVQSLTRTSVQHISNGARRETWKINPGLVTQEVYIATLDSRTTPICRGLDGKLFEIEKGAQPPVHIACRSFRTPVVDGVAQGKRPSKPTTERQLLREFSKANNIKAPTKRANLPRGTKADFDKFSRKRIREISGQVPATQTYQQFLMNQSKAVQEDILGIQKAKLFRDGGLTLDRFTNRVGDELTLSELAQRHKDVFKAAGLDPADF